VADSGWEACAFRRRFRRYQSMALDAVDRLAAVGERQAYVVMPPGSGKTALALEIARRLGRRTLVLTPQTAVQGQWVAQWREFGPPGREHPCPASTDRSLQAAVTVLTYQALSVWDRTADDEDVEDDLSAGTAARRRAAVRGDAGADLLDLLHPHGRDLVRRAAAMGPWTLVLDECHHLLETWGALVRALVQALGPDTWVVGLTATPPTELTAAQRALHDEVFGDRDFEVPTPAVVKEGDLAPYQELVYLTAPTAEEDTWIASERTRFADLQVELLSTKTGTLPLAEWLRRRLQERRTGEGGAQVPWRETEAAEPELARAALRMAGVGLIEVPDGAHLREEHRVPPDARDWAAVLDAYAREHLVPSTDLGDERLLRAIREVLPGLGWQSTIRGLRTATSPVDRVCALSESKPAAAVHILDVERSALGDDLRALVLCDFEQRPAAPPSRLKEAGPGRLAGSARLALSVLALSDLGPSLRPVLVTGRTVAMRRQDVPDLRAFAPAGIAPRLRIEPLDGSPELVQVLGDAAWTPRVWTPLLTAWLVSGGTKALVGTRALLGEGWDCPPLNVVVDLTAAATATSVTQLRGRSLRLDPARPDKVADNWTVVTVADDHPRGDADYLRAVRKHANHLAPGPEGEIESGIGHCDDALGPYTPPPVEQRPAVNAASLARAADKAAAREMWRVGEGYRGTTVETVRVRTGRPLGLPGGVVPPGVLSGTTTLGTSAAPPRARRRPPPLWPLPVGAGVVTGASAAVPATAADGAVVGVGAAVASALVLGGARYGAQMRRLQRSCADGETASLRQLAAAVADALHAAGGTSVGAAAVSVHAGRDGWLRCELEAPVEQSRLFVSSLDELLAPLADPRWLVSRLVLPVPAGTADRRRLALARTLGRRVEAAVAWHAVPSWLSRSKARVSAFDDAWHAHVGPSRLVSGRDPEGQALLELLRGADPFALTSRVRTVWR
jgi:superfamily II DNA or RNA helicase